MKKALGEYCVHYDLKKCKGCDGFGMKEQMRQDCYESYRNYYDTIMGDR